MKAENEVSLPNFHRQSSKAFRRRVYIASIVSLSVFLLCIAAWPLTANTFRTTASVRVRISPAMEGQLANSGLTQRTNQVASQRVDAEYFLKTLHLAVEDSLTDAALASCIRRAVMQQRPGIAPLQIQQLRDSLDIRVARTMAEPHFRTIQVSRVGQGSHVDQRVVNAIVQEISSRLSRKANYRAVEERVQKHVNQIALDNRRWASGLVAMVLETRNACERFEERLDQLALQLDGAARSQQQVSGELQQHIEQVQQQVLTSDLQLLRGLREQMIGHFDVDETDGMVQHVERLINDREVVLAQIAQASAASQSAPADKVRSNPFMMASFGKNRQQQNQSDLQTSATTLASLRLDETYQMLDQLKLSLENPLVGQIPMLPVEREIQQQPSQFLITDLQSAKPGVPVDAVPSTQWLLGMSMVAGLIGIAFSLSSHPHQLGKAIHTPNQLASLLGLEHLGTVPSQRQKPGWLERSFSSVSSKLFRASEVCVLLILCGLIVAMIWDNQLPGLIADQPVNGFCRAVWILFGRGS